MADSAQRMLAEIRQLAPDIHTRTAQIEAGRQLPVDLVEAMRSIGVFRMYVPQSHGGLAFDIPTAMKVVQLLSRIDGSVGWCAGIGATAPVFATRLPRKTYDHMYRHGPNVIVAGAVQPTGTIKETAGGWRVDGRWAFASGCTHADWLFGICVVTANGKPLAGPDGSGEPPMLRGVMLPAGDWQIEDTWNTAGLKGTGSHHIALKDAIVPADNLFDPVNGVPCVAGAIYDAVAHVLPPMGSAIAVGIAEGALDAIVELANTGRQQFRMAVPMRDSEIFQCELGRIEAELRAARSLHGAEADNLSRRAQAGTLKDDALYTRCTQSTVWIANACVRVADACFALGGGAAVYDSSPLQQRLRDLHVLMQHAALHQRHYVTAGKMLLRG
ncbi:MAG TPA: acyl-CoA dehydrogenase family protein [Paraburkholderia sp.]|jgi:alkylation response protein AidB-like acyl-CoA dehydrogenase